MRNSGTGYVNFTSIEAALAARETLTQQRLCDVLPCEPGQGDEPMQISFTSAQQNCRRRQEMRGGGMGGGGGGGMGGGGRGVLADAIAQGMAQVQQRHAPRNKGPATGPSRSIYVGNLPPTITMPVLASLAVPWGLLESLRFMPQQTYGFLTFAEEPDAVRFWEAGQSGRISLQGQRLVLNWARVPPYDPVLSRKIDDGATRHLQARPRIAAPHRPRISAEAGHLSPRPQR